MKLSIIIPNKQLELQELLINWHQTRKKNEMKEPLNYNFSSNETLSLRPQIV